MLQRLRRHLTYANVMATLAIFIVLGGGAYAAIKIPKNSVGSKQLKKNAVITKKIHNNAVVSSKIKPNAVTGGDIKEGTLGTIPRASDLTYKKHFKLRVNANDPDGVDFQRIGPFTLNAFCQINNANTDKVDLRIKSSQAHSAFDASPENNDMTADTLFSFRSGTATPTGTTNIEYSSMLGGGSAPDGTRFFGLFSVNVNPPGHVGQCEFIGDYDVATGF